MARLQANLLEWAESLSLQALGHILADAETASRFLDLTGHDEMSLRTSLSSRPFLAAILDYLVSDEPLLLDFAQTHGVSPHEVLKAQSLLAGRPALYEL